MGASQRLNLLGIFLTLLFIVFGELVWLPDPIRLGYSVYWIQLINYAVYCSITIPLLWSISAAAGIRQIWKLKRDDQSLQPLQAIWVIVKMMILISSILAIYYILIIPAGLVWLIVFLAAAWLLILLDISLFEWITNRRVPRRGLTYLGLSIGLLFVLLWPTSYLVTYPGLTMNMNQYAHVGDIKTDREIEGVLIFERPAFPIDWMYAKLFSQYEFVKRQKIEIPLAQQLQEVRIQQIDANELGSAVAFQKVGLGRGAVSKGARIVALVKGSPASKQIRTGDVVIRMNGRPITSTAEFIALMSKIRPGDEIHLIVLRNSKEISIAVKPQADLAVPAKAVMGVQITDELQLDLPLKVNFQDYLLHVGGPSHGAVLTLALIDQLTPGGVIKGNRVAGTGTVDIHGIIGPIGGISQKAYSIERSGADVFFVPAEQLKDARKGAGHLNIVPVKTIDDMIKWLREHPKN